MVSKAKLIPIRLPPIFRKSANRFFRYLPSCLLFSFIILVVFITLLELANIQQQKFMIKFEKNVYSSLNTIQSNVLLKNNTLTYKIYSLDHFDNFSNLNSLNSRKKAIQNSINFARVERIIKYLLNQQLSKHYSINSLQYSNLSTMDEKPEAHSSQVHFNSKPLCPLIPPNLEGNLKINLNSSAFNLSETNKNGSIKIGGAWKPSFCIARHKVAIIIPYRDRKNHLDILLYHLHRVLQKQLLMYSIYVVEQFGTDTFNKGVLMNAGFKEALKDNQFHCFVFHDVDLIPEDDRNLYSCPFQPRHMSPAVDKFFYNLPYQSLIGGVFSISTTHFLQINGYSNLYWGWGGEDDDMAERVKKNQLYIIRPPESIGKYKMIKHNKRVESPVKIRSILLKSARTRADRDGVSSVSYNLISKTKYNLYTHLIIDIDKKHKWLQPSKNEILIHL